MIRITTCTQADLHDLQKVSIETFRNTFEHTNSTEDMDAYIKEAYHMKKLQRELSEKESFFFFIYQEKQLAGYMKLNTGNQQTENRGMDSLEIERIYVRKNFQQRGLGRKLLEKAQHVADKADKKCLWLGVWERNYPALAFYHRLGFIQSGVHTFLLGTDKQTDFIMEKQIGE